MPRKIQHPVSMHHVWRCIRSPFYTVRCTSIDAHRWERYDCDRAGCLLCGAEHVCCASINLNQDCLLEEQSDHSYTCKITGLSIPTTRIADGEYVDHCVFNTYGKSVDAYKNLHYEEARENVAFFINNFLFHRKMQYCKCKENEKKILKVHAYISRCLKQFKLLNQDKLPSMHHVISQVMYGSEEDIGKMFLFCVKNK